jgi:iron complex transport system substrate-binding protein
MSHWQHHFIKRRSIAVLIALILMVVCLFVQSRVRVGLLITDTSSVSRVEGDVLYDPAGVAHSLKKPAQRIVSAVLASDEMLEALDVRERMVGVTFLVDDEAISGVTPHYYPPSIARVKAEAENILALNPDLVFVTNFTQPETVQLLMGSGVPVARLGSLVSFKDTERNLRLVGSAIGKRDEIETIITDMWQTIDAVHSKVKTLKKPTVLYYAQDGYTEGAGAFMDEVIDLAGGENVVKSVGIRGGMNISEELAVSLQPEVIILSSWSADNTDEYVQRILKNRLWQEVPAVKNKRVYLVRGSWLISTSQTRAKGVEEIARLLHPEAF